MSSKFKLHQVQVYAGATMEPLGVTCTLTKVNTDCATAHDKAARELGAFCDSTNFFMVCCAHGNVMD